MDREKRMSPFLIIRMDCMVTHTSSKIVAQ